MANYNMTPDCGCSQRPPQRQNGCASGRPQRPTRTRPPMPHPCPDHTDPLSGMAIAMAYVPWQFMNETYEPDKALQYGTIFPELNKPFYGKGGCMR